MKALILLALITLAGCASVIQSTDRNVIVKHGYADAASAIPLADAECSKHGKRARLDQMNCPYTCLSQFRCE